MRYAGNGMISLTGLSKKTGIDVRKIAEFLESIWLIDGRGEPTDIAFEQKIVEKHTRPSPVDGNRSTVVCYWNEERVIKMLRQNGFVIAQDADSDQQGQVARESQFSAFA